MLSQSLETALKLCLADPGLRSTSGHHAGALVTLAAACGADELVCFGHQAADEDLRSLAKRLQVPLHPHFSSNFYDGYEKNWSIAESQPYVQALTNDYLKLFDHLEAAGADGVLHHTMDWTHLFALAAALNRHASSVQYPTQIVFLMFNPGVDYRGKVIAPRRFLSFRIALAMLSDNPKVRIFAASSELSRIYRSVLNVPVPVDVHPCFFFNAAAGGAGQQISRHASSIDRDSAIRMVLYLGDAKAEKGFCNLPELTRRFLRQLKDDAEIQIHYVLNDLLTSESLVRTANELDCIARDDNRVKLYKNFLSETELRAMLEACSVVVFNYSPVIYANKTSGFLWQACSIGAPVAVIGDSWLSREAKVLCPFARVFDDVESLERELKRYGTIKFQTGKPVLEYRRALFRPLGEFFRQTISQDDPASLSDSSSTTQKALFVDIGLPNSSASAGGHAAWQEMAMFQALGYSVTFVPLDGCTLSAEELGAYRERNVEVCAAPDWPDALTTLYKRGKEFDVIYITRFNVAEPLVNAVREYAPQAQIILNVADLHYLRHRRHAEIFGYSAQTAEKIRQRELAVLSQVDMVLTYTDEEMALINAELGDRVRVRKCPWVDEIQDVIAPFESRRDIAFLGSYLHAPNPDAVIWFAETVMPILRTALPGVQFRVYGSGMSAESLGNVGDDVQIEGFVEDLSTVYDQCRVFVAPLRFGAGLKGKVAGALCRGTPCVLSPVAAEGIASGNELFAAVVQSPREWVEAIVRVYNDKSAWNAASNQALDYASKRYTFKNALVQMRKITEDLHSPRGS